MKWVKVEHTRMNKILKKKKKKGQITILHVERLYRPPKKKRHREKK